MWDCPDSQEVGLEAATLERVRNSSLVDVSVRRKCNGAQAEYRSGGLDAAMHVVVGELSVSL